MMRRKDREVRDNEEILGILYRCDTVRIAMLGEKYPYIVPVSFGMEVMNDKVIIYFHCAQQGLKVNLLKKNPNVYVEGDIFIKVEKTGHGITARYESIIGFGKCYFVSDEDEIAHGLKLMTEHYGYFDYPLDRCAGVHHLLIGKILLEEITGKRNLPGTMTPADKAAQNLN
ncbi:pyridoxamine 5'-phosphate oxidase family protein [Akkermansia muciniphila]|uniref:pyridoxamine 5'-phosphate oxidase family protein n=1 Tax=Akkermansia muciniphila TaxID=239935 RepID=UPI000F0B275B|nr:pyridoxamine 5'-phosphate oxidase family protein [Akkermansia muciniphila]AYR28057.1 5-nitroimidazole antibiotic resistance protein [Akkermansia muciniphila]